MPSVFAPAPFRYQGIDYPYGWQDLPNNLADVLEKLQFVVYAAAGESIPFREYTAATLPDAATYGKGYALIDGQLQHCDGATWNPVGSGGGSVTATSLIANNPPTYGDASGLKSPLIGSIRDFSPVRPKIVGRLAQINTTADLYSVPGFAADVATTDPLSAVADTACRITMADGNNHTVWGKVLSSGVNVTGKLIRIVSRSVVKTASQPTVYELRLYTTGNPGSPPSNYHKAVCVDLWKLGINRWHGFTVPISAFTAAGSGADLTNIKYMGFNMTCNTESRDFGYVDVVEPLLKKGKVILSFDDAKLTQWTKAAKAMNDRGLRGVLYPSTTVNVGANPATTYGLQTVNTLHDVYGWQIASQAWETENPTGQSQDTFEAGLQQIRNWHGCMGITGGLDGSYFSNVGTNDTTRYPSFRKFFRSMRAFTAVQGTDLPPFYTPETWPLGDPMAIKAWGTAGTDTSTKMIAHAQQAADHKGLAMYVWHDIDDTILGNMTTFFDWLVANRNIIDVVTLDDLFQIRQPEIIVKSGTASVQNGSTIAHGLGYAPAWAVLQPTAAKRLAAVTALDATNITISLYDDTGAAIAVAENVIWKAEL